MSSFRSLPGVMGHKKRWKKKQMESKRPSQINCSDRCAVNWVVGSAVAPRAGRVQRKYERLCKGKVPEQRC